MAKKKLSPDELFKLAFEHHKQNNLKKAETTYKKLLNENPQYYPALGNLGNLFIQLKKYSLAVKYLKKCIDIKPNSVEAYNNLGNIFFLLKNINESINYFQKAIDINPNFTSAYNNLGFVLQKIGDHEKAKTCYEQSISINPKNLNTLNNLGIVFIALGHTKKAISIFNNIIKNDSNYAKAYFNIYPLLINNDINIAIKHLKQATTCSPEKYDYQIFLVILLEYAGKYNEAKKYIKQKFNYNKHCKALIESWRYIQSKKIKTTKMISSTRHVLSLAKKHSKKNGLILEFGVRFGTSIRQISDIFSCQIHGFDSFEGLPETWHNIPKKFYSTSGKIPSVSNNVNLHIGLFENTLPKFIKKNKDFVRFINIDCDIYSSTKTVLELLSKQIQPGTIILFDEYIGNQHWREDEYKAFQESVRKYNWKYQYLAFSVQTKQVLIKII